MLANFGAGSGLTGDGRPVSSSAGGMCQLSAGEAAGRRSEVQATHGVTISCAAAADVVAAIDALALRCAPQVLSQRLVVLRNDLIRCITRVTTQFGTSAEVDSAADVLALDPRDLIDTETAAKKLNITGDGVRWLCNNERLAATKKAGRWWIDPASIDLYLANQRKRER